MEVARRRSRWRACVGGALLAVLPRSAAARACGASSRRTRCGEEAARRRESCTQPAVATNMSNSQRWHGYRLNRRPPPSPAAWMTPALLSPQEVVQGRLLWKVGSGGARVPYVVSE